MIATSTSRLRILYLDIEGGTGGSARSLCALVEGLCKMGIQAEVISRKWGPVAARYRELGVEFSVEKGLLTLPTALRHEWFGPLRALGTFIRYPLAISRLLDRVRKFSPDVIHVNHTSLFPTALLLRIFVSIPVVMHVRVQNYDTIINRLFAKGIIRSADFFLFISKGELETLRSLSGCQEIPGQILYNIVTKHKRNPIPPLELRGFESRFKVISLKNIQHATGVDRLIDISLRLRDIGNAKVLFVILGREKERGCLESIQQQISKFGLTEYFLFLGSRIDPESFLSHCQALINLSRRANPWGRDILEAISAGVPPIFIGKTIDAIDPTLACLQKFDNFDPQKVAKQLGRLSDDLPYYENVRAALIDGYKGQFDSETIVGEVAERYCSLSRSHS